MFFRRGSRARATKEVRIIGLNFTTGRDLYPKNYSVVVVTDLI